MKKREILFFFLLIMAGWWCRNDQSSTFKNSSSGSQNSKNSMLQIQENFCFIFNKVKRILIDLKGQSLQFIFYEEKNLEDKDDVYRAYCCFKIGKQQIRQKVGSWIHQIDNKKEFLSYFNLRSSVNANNRDLVKEELSNKNEKAYNCSFDYIYYFDLALSLNLGDEVNRCLQFILKKEETVPLLLLKLKLLKLTKTHCYKNLYKSIEKHFSEKFDDYFCLIQNNEFWKGSQTFSDKLGISPKLMLAEVLKQLKLKNWNEKNWEEPAFQEYEKSFSIKPFLSPKNLNNQNLFKAQEKWIENKLKPKIWELWLWQKLRQLKKIPNFLLEQIFSEDHFKILRNCIQNRDRSEVMSENIILFLHHDLHSAVEKWVENLKQFSNAEKEVKLLNILGLISIFEILLDL